jgi:hypothetical protein
MTAAPNVIESWNVRGRAYLALAKRYPIFRTLAMRLARAVMGDKTRALVDIGGGFGLASEIVLDAFPELRVTMVDPSAVMREIASEEMARFGDRIAIIDGDTDDLPLGPFDAALSSAVMHLVDETLAFPAISARLLPGARFAFNIWGHSFEDTAEDPDPAPVWKASLDEAIARLGLNRRPPEGPAPLPPRIRTRAGIEIAADESGLEVVAIEIDEDHPPASFHLDFTAMSPKFLPRLRPEVRVRTIDLARELAVETTLARTARLVLAKK